MKLRQLDDEYVKSVLNNMDRLWELSANITNESRKRIEEAYKNHINEYTWLDVLNPFTSKIKSVDAMVSKITNYEYSEFDITGSEFLEKRGFTEYLSTGRNAEARTCYFTEKKYNDLIAMAVRIGKLDIEKLKRKHYLLESFPANELDFDEDDFILFDRLASLVNTLDTGWKEYQNAI